MLARAAFAGRSLASKSRGCVVGNREHMVVTMASSSREDADARAKRKAQKKAAKLARRAKRQGLQEAIDEKKKDCDLCSPPVDLLVRCQTDETRRWRMVCGKCWHEVSGGQTDGDDDHPYYKYGGLWKNRAA